MGVLIDPGGRAESEGGDGRTKRELGGFVFRFVPGTGRPTTALRTRGSVPAPVKTLEDVDQLCNQLPFYPQIVQCFIDVHSWKPAGAGQRPRRIPEQTA
jgi:hypothetical protein